MTTSEHSNGNGADAGELNVDPNERSTGTFFKEKLLKDADQVDRKDIEELESSVPKKLAGFNLKNLGSLEEGVKWFNTMLDRVSTLYTMIRDREYKVPPKTLALIAAGLIYFVLPTDLTPDFIPGLGYLDDAMVLSALWKMVNEEVEKYLSSHRRVFPE